ncbi:MAG: hypothetical protein Q9185_001884 [Variospora sp. 1 TL-2023]
MADFFRSPPGNAVGKLQVAGFVNVLLRPTARGINEYLDWNSHDDFFRYTSGRWAFNEAKQLACRYIKFDMNELARIAAQSIGALPCTKIEKYQEGQFNKIFLMTTEDGKEVIMKIPQPNAGRPHFTTASEVATMHYVRNELGLPVPEIYTWNSNAVTNTVGAEYIVMEKAPGLELGRVWPDLNGKERRQIIEQLVQYQKKFTASTFPGIGSLYYAGDLDECLSYIPVREHLSRNASIYKDFVIGPINDQRLFEQGRGDVVCDRGPCKYFAHGYDFPPLMNVGGSCMEDYVVALGRHEMSYVRSSSKLPSPGMFGPGWYQPSADKKIAALEDYIKIARYLPPNDSLVTAAVLWHDDLHSGNIFVHPDNLTQITCIIDWQSSNTLPLIRHNTRPAFLDYEGPKLPLGIYGEARKGPQLPADFQELSQGEQREAQALVRQQALYKLFEMYSAAENPNVSRAILHRETLRCVLIDSAAITAYHSEPNLKARLVDAVDAWEELVGRGGPPCPLHYPKDDRIAQTDDFTQWSDCLGLKDVVIESLGGPVDWDGATSAEEYSAAREKLQTTREEFLHLVVKHDEERDQWIKAWPFVDDEGYQ